jgi:hypothetical protein
MNSLDSEDKILAMARGLGVTEEDAVENILRFCQERVRAVWRKTKALATIWDLERALCDDLNLTIHEIHNDEELNELSLRYATEAKDPVFGSLAMHLEGKVCGVLFQLKYVVRNGERCFVAFIDCRGEKNARRFFTRWHEIAHRLTLFEQFEMPFRRTTIPEVQRDPIERLMDMIAADVGFFDPLFQPVLIQAVRLHGFTFDVVEKVRSEFCPDASFQATLNACAGRMKTPLILIEAALALKKSEREHAAGTNDSPDAPKPMLRVVVSIPNDAARKQGIYIPKNMRVPEESVIFKSFSQSLSEPEDTFEDPACWSSSDGKHLPSRHVRVHARCLHGKVLAVIQPIRQIKLQN